MSERGVDEVYCKIPKVSSVSELAPIVVVPDVRRLESSQKAVAS